MKKIIWLLCIFVSFQFVSFSQSPKYRVVSIPVERTGINMRQPWVGGLNSPQFSAIDLNGDNHKDIFIFDRVGDKVLTYINNGNGTDSTFDYSPKYEQLFPGMSAWALIRDYNNDGIPDIFTHANSGTMVFKGRMDNGVLKFDTLNPLLMYSDPPYNVNIWTNISDIPVFTDVNFDGDLDVLTYGVFGGSVEYYENQTVEHAGNPHYAVDSLQYILETTCWGNFIQSGTSNSILIDQSCKGSSGLGSQAEGARHSGNAIFSFDNDNDHDIDLLNGNIGYDNLMLLENGGDSSYAHITNWDSIYPVCNTPILMPSYPAAFGLDANNDSFEDLLISPNVNAGGRDVKNVMLYKNVNNQLCNFEYQSDSFLVHDMLDFGTDSKPVFFDFNGDGLKDIIVGNFGYFRPYQTYKGTLAYYENTGTATQPKFKMRSEDYSSFSSYQLVAVHPAFGDLDGDGHEDMVVGELNGYLQYFRNTGGTVANFSALTTPQYFGIDAGQYSAPFIYDMNGDSLLDLLVGRKDGKITYYWNYGTKTVPQFSADSSNVNFGNVNVTQVGYSEGYAQPLVMKEGSQLKLYVGSYRGSIFKYDINTNNLRSGSFSLVDSDFLKSDVGTKAVVSMADLNNDGLLEYVVGNSRGGLLIYSDSLWDPSTVLSTPVVLPDSKYLTIYPNPARDYFVCAMEGTDLNNAKTELFNIVGERVAATITQSNNRISIGTNELSNGFYIVRVTQAGKTYTGKILIER